MTMADSEGFEPPVLSYACFQDKCLRPLGQLSEVTQEARTSIPESQQLNVL